MRKRKLVEQDIVVATKIKYLKTPGNTPKGVSTVKRKTGGRGCHQNGKAETSYELL